MPRRRISRKYVLAAPLIFAGASGASASRFGRRKLSIKLFGLTDIQTGLLNSLPFGLASVLMVLWGRSSDARGERVWPLAFRWRCWQAAWSWRSGLALSCQPLRSCASTATYIVKGPFWALSTEWLSVGAAAAGIAQINGIGNIGGFFGTTLLGLIKDATGSYPLGLLPLALLSGIGCLLVLALGRGREGGMATRPAR
jgi:hypothetical protein